VADYFPSALHEGHWLLAYLAKGAGLRPIAGTWWMRQIAGLSRFAQLSSEQHRRGCRQLVGASAGNCFAIAGDWESTFGRPTSCRNSGKRHGPAALLTLEQVPALLWWMIGPGCGGRSSSNRPVASVRGRKRDKPGADCGLRSQLAGTFPPAFSAGSAEWSWISGRWRGSGF
jgi:hypothetical protein